jgi:protein O-mannosyl-transferase
MVLQFISIGSAMYAERYTYVPYLGLMFLIGMLVFNVSKEATRYAWIVIGVISLSFSYLAHERVKVWHNAETLWTDMIEKYPGQYKGYLGRGNYYAAQNEGEKAVQDFTNAIKYNAGYRAYSNRAAELMKLKMPEKALEDIEVSLRLFNRQPEAYITRAQIELAQNKLDSALLDVNTALKIKPTYEGYFTRAAIYKAKNNFDEALANYTEAAKLTNDVSLYVNRGNVYYAKGEYDMSINDYNIVLNRSPDNINALANRGSAYYQLNKIDEALSDYNRVITLRPNEMRYYVSRSYMYDKKGDKQNAWRDAQFAMQSGAVFPNDYLARISQ